MIDHILVYPSEVARDEAWPAPEDNPPSWTDDAGRSVLPTRVVIDRATYTAKEKLKSPETVAPGSWIIIRTLRADADLSEQAVMVFSDGVMVKNTLPENPGQFDPMWAGTEYDYSN